MKVLHKEEEEGEEEDIVTSIQMDAVTVDLHSDLSVTIRQHDNESYLTTAEVYALVDAFSSPEARRAIRHNPVALKTYQNWYGTNDQIRARDMYPVTRDDGSHLDRFLHEHTHERLDATITAHELWSTYHKWARQQGIQFPLHQAALGRALSQRGYTSQRQTINAVKSTVYLNVALKP